MSIKQEATELLRERYTRILLNYAQQLAEQMSDPTVSAAQAEKGLAQAVRQMGAELLCEGLSVRCGSHTGPRECRCGAVMEHEGRRGRRVVTVLGSGIYRRAYYRCPACHATYYAGDKQLGIEQTGYTLPAQELVCLSSAELPFDSACEHLVRLTGIDVSPKQCQRISHLWGKELESEQAAEREALMAGHLEYLVAQGSGTRRYVTLDATKTHFTDGWHETRVGAVYDVTQNHRGEDTPALTTYVAGVREPVGEFAERLYQEGCRRGCDRAAELIVVADGAPWIWNLVQEYFPGAREVLDYYHAAERLYTVAQAVYGEKSKEGLQWAQDGCGLLLESELEAVLSRLRALAPGSEAGREAVRLAIGYYETNRGRMGYKELLAGGYHIGSGVVEAGCKLVVGLRCKRPGMNWTQPGAQQILALRCSLLSGRWDEHWERAA